MLPPSQTESTEATSPVYDQELREFLASRGLPTGSPEALVTFLDALHDAAFRDEMESIIRSISYREGERLRTGPMAALVSHAVAGDPEAHAASFPDAQRRLTAFVLSALRSSQESPERGEQFELADPSTPKLVEASDPVSIPTAPPELEGRLQPFVSETFRPREDTSGFRLPDIRLDDRTDLEHTTGSLPTNDRLSAAITQLTSADGLVARAPRIQAEPGAASKPLRLPPEIAGERPRPHGLYWAAGAALLLASIGGATYLRHKPLTREKTHVTDAADAVIPAGGDTAASQPGPPTQAKGSPSEAGQTSTAAPPEYQPPESSSAETPAAEEPNRPPASVRVPHGRNARTAVTPRSTPERASSPAEVEPREAVFLASSGVMASHLVYAPAPNYPAIARLTHLEGQVIAQVVVSREGAVEATRILSGPYLLRGAVEHAIHRWRYRPYVLNGNTTDVTTVVTVSFRLKH